MICDGNDGYTCGPWWLTGLIFRVLEASVRRGCAKPGCRIIVVRYERLR